LCVGAAWLSTVHIIIPSQTNVVIFFPPISPTRQKRKLPKRESNDRVMVYCICVHVHPERMLLCYIDSIFCVYVTQLITNSFCGVLAHIESESLYHRCKHSIAERNFMQRNVEKREKHFSSCKECFWTCFSILLLPLVAYYVLCN